MGHRNPARSQQAPCRTCRTCMPYVRVVGVPPPPWSPKPNPAPRVYYATVPAYAFTS